MLYYAHKVPIKIIFIPNTILISFCMQITNDFKVNNEKFKRLYI